MRRLRVIVALGALLGMFAGVLTASPALAGRSHKWVLVPATPFTLAAGFCGFQIRVTLPVDKEYDKTLKTSDGSMIILGTGSLKASLTNLSTGKVITENVSGPAKLTIHPDGSATGAAKGHVGPIALTPADAQRFGLPTVSITSGALTESVAANGVLTSLTLKGHILVDVCTALS